MRTVILLPLCTLCLMAFIGCDNDDDDDQMQPPVTNLTGLWAMTRSPDDDPTQVEYAYIQISQSGNDLIGSYRDALVNGLPLDGTISGATVSATIDYISSGADAANTIAAGSVDPNDVWHLTGTWVHADDSGTWEALRVVADNAEPNNDFVSATTILPNKSQSHSLHLTTDVDYFMFSLAQQSDVVIETEGIRAMDTVLDLYNSAQGFLTQDDDSGVGTLSKIETTLAPGTYYAVVSCYGTTGPYPLYQLTLTATAAYAN